MDPTFALVVTLECLRSQNNCALDPFVKDTLWGSKSCITLYGFSNIYFVAYDRTCIWRRISSEFSKKEILDYKVQMCILLSVPVVSKKLKHAQFCSEWITVNLVEYFISE